ncbi:MAG: DUF1206 domain-containing protein [Solirubrobacteraceae bacterium]
MSREAKRAFTAIGVVGHLARMVVFGLVGYGLVMAAINYDPHSAIGLDGALNKLSRQSYGPVLLGVVAAIDRLRAVLHRRRPLPQHLTRGRFIRDRVRAQRLLDETRAAPAHSAVLSKRDAAAWAEPPVRGGDVRARRMGHQLAMRPGSAGRRGQGRGPDAKRGADPTSCRAVRSVPSGRVWLGGLDAGPELAAPVQLLHRRAQPWYQPPLASRPALAC